jgi:CubicO group peptidase (beta-lactamase class C family)
LIVDDLTTELPAILDRYRVPGVTVSLIRDGTVVLTGAGGEHRLGDGEPMRRDTRFRVAKPYDLLSIVASFREHDAQRLDLGDAVQFVMETNVAPTRPTASPPRLAPGTVAVTRLGPVGVAAARPPATLHDDARSLPSLLRSLVEESSGTGFDRYCRVEILDPLGISGDTIGSGEPRDGGAVAHSVFGTPLESGIDERPDARCMIASAEEIARLITSTMPGKSGGTSVQDLDRRLAELARVDERAGGALDVPLRLGEDVDGPCFELAEERGGTGCLARWYPDERCGVVVLYNAETGAEAARRIAQLVLGGRSPRLPGPRGAARGPG